MTKHKRAVSASAMDGVGGGIFMIGLGVLFLVDEISFWPWILVLCGIASLPSTFAHGEAWNGIQGLLWMVGLAIMFDDPGLFWPGILILTGISIMVGAISQPGPQKAKRGADISASERDTLPDQHA